MGKSEDNMLMAEIANCLVERGLITKDQLTVAQVTKKNLGGDIGRILIKKGFIQEDDVRTVLIEQLHLEEVVLAELPIDPAVVKAVPHSVALKFNCLPLYRVEDVMTVAISDPLALFGLADMQAVVNCEIRPVLANAEHIQEAIRAHYQAQEGSMVREDSIQVVNETGGDDADERETLREMAAGARVINSVNTIISRACRDRASDIHIEPQEDGTRIRYRLDGMLEERMIFPKNLHLPIVSRLKVMAGMDIAERRVPQDGRVRLKVRGSPVDLRLSTYPTTYGEKIVIRLLIKEAALTLEQLGLMADDKLHFTEIITRPHGIFLVTGPTGSGKTSTLYAALARVNSQDVNIVSIEDPVENEIAGVSQAQVNIKAGMTFAAALRSILRQDPDVIMIGEIRDRETADMAVRAALTGHLVLSTLHTNTAIGAVERLNDMGVERFLIGSALIGVMAQRLVRRICNECREQVEPDDATKAMMKIFEYDGPVFRGRGCRNCRMSGFRGRMGMFELVSMDEELRHMITKGSPEDELRRCLRARACRDMRVDGLEKVREGQTTLEEVMRVTQEG